ncbi:MAG: ferrous iron transport protein A [Pirellulales bacterium]|nr:ferrous iron transport protein A [Pirellulales bacterium]
MVTQAHHARVPEEPGVALTMLAPGTTARVTAVAGEHGESTRLKALGLCAGRHVQVASAGDPLIVRVLGTRVGVAARLAEQVTVVPDASSGC